MNGYPLVHFTPAVGWHKEITTLLQQLVQLEKDKTNFYVYEVLVKLSSLWLTMRKNIILPAGTERKCRPSSYAKNFALY